MNKCLGDVVFIRCCCATQVCWNGYRISTPWYCIRQVPYPQCCPSDEFKRLLWHISTSSLSTWEVGIVVTCIPEHCLQSCWKTGCACMLWHFSFRMHAAYGRWSLITTIAYWTWNNTCHKNQQLVLRRPDVPLHGWSVCDELRTYYARM